MVYVITGGPGFGKSALIIKLQQLGYPVGGEIARQIIEQQIEGGAVGFPWKDASAFEKLVMNKRIEFLNSIDIETIAFSDRGLPDQAAFSWFKGKDVSPELQAAIGLNRYAKKVFLTPPWREIYRNDQIRTETFDEAERIHHFIAEAYLKNGYELIELPFVTVDKRIKFILKSL